jgi:hypothetical protein
MNIGEANDFQAVTAYLRDQPPLDTPEGKSRLVYAANAARRLQERAYKALGAGEVAETSTWRTRLGTLPRKTT